MGRGSVLQANLGIYIKQIYISKRFLKECFWSH